jgi:hypothetical protein
MSPDHDENARITLRKRVEDNLALWALGLMLAGFLAGYRVKAELMSVGGAAMAATDGATDSLRSTSVLDRFLVMVKSYPNKAHALDAANSLFARGYDARIYESDNGRFALGFPAASKPLADKLRLDLIAEGTAGQDAYVSTAAKLRTRWLLGP